MEFKGRNSLLRFLHRVRILIESQWNLKVIILFELNFWLLILIESQWNLKHGQGVRPQQQQQY